MRARLCLFIEETIKSLPDPEKLLDALTEKACKQSSRPVLQQGERSFYYLVKFPELGTINLMTAIGRLILQLRQGLRRRIVSLFFSRYYFADRYLDTPPLEGGFRGRTISYSFDTNL